MNKNFKNRILATFTVLAGISVVFVPFSLFVGWSLITLILFWFVITPLLASFLPMVSSRSNNHLLESLTGMSLFYVLIVFLIYKHYESDTFQVMMVSYGVNLILVSIVIWLKKPAVDTSGL